MYKTARRSSNQVAFNFMVVYQGSEYETSSVISYQSLERPTKALRIIFRRHWKFLLMSAISKVNAILVPKDLNLLLKRRRVEVAEEMPDDVVEYPTAYQTIKSHH